MPIPPGPANASPPSFNKIRLYFGSLIGFLVLHKESKKSFQQLAELDEKFPCFVVFDN
jgi:hypothetical protein